jgi:hypothetical protein
VQSPTLSGVENTASQLFMPWVTSPALAAFESKGPFAEDLYGPNTPYGKSVPAGGSQANLAAAEQIAEEFGGPLNDLARALYGHGGTMYNTDTPVLHLAGIGSVVEKPGSTTQQTGPLSGLLGRTLDKVLDPFHPTTFHTSGSSGDAHLGTYVGGKGNAFAGGRGGTYAGGR